MAVNDLERVSVSMKEACALTGLSRSTIERLIREGTFPARQLFGRNGRWLIPLDGLRRWINDQPPS